MSRGEEAIEEDAQGLMARKRAVLAGVCFISLFVAVSVIVAVVAVVISVVVVVIII